MLYAKVVLGLPVEGPFDYIVPEGVNNRISIGSRVRVSFGPRKKIGYVVGLTQKTSVKKLKELSEVIDNYPVLDKNMLCLTKELSEYYCCSWGEAIETALPQGVRKGRKMPELKNAVLEKKNSSYNPAVILVHDLSGTERWKIYLESIKECLNAGKSSIVMLPDKDSILNAKEIIQKELNSKIALIYRNMPKEQDEWLRIKSGGVDIVIGARSGVFAPLSDLGLLIIDEEQDSVYKQDQSPHYHSRQVALMRAKMEKAGLILGSTSPSLESLGLVKKGIAKYVKLSLKKTDPQIRIIDTKTEYLRLKSKNIFISKYLEDAVAGQLNSSGKTLIVINRRGFATCASCNNCQKALRCPRCNINLVFHFKENALSCHYCNFKMEIPKICPNCNSGYIKFSGVGTEKVESELSRIFPQARIKRIEKDSAFSPGSADIFVSTSLVTKRTDYDFDLVCVLGADNYLNRPDFRSSEKAFSLLTGLLRLAAKQLIVQTGFPQHKIFEAVLKNDFNLFYEEELKERKQLNFPPYNHLILAKLRSKSETKAKDGALALFKKLNTKSKYMQVLSVNVGQPAKLRGNFYWQLLISSGNPGKAVKILKTQLKDFRHSGIIVTVDVDPL